jgi:hypothetical protein
VRGPVSLFRADGTARARIDSRGHMFHRDATVNRADAGAKIAADALFIDDLESALAIDGLRDCLVRCVFADNMTATALDAEILIDHGLLDIVQVQVLPVGNARHGFADQVAAIHTQRVQGRRCPAVIDRPQSLIVAIRSGKTTCLPDVNVL